MVFYDILSYLPISKESKNIYMYGFRECKCIIMQAVDKYYIILFVSYLLNFKN